MASCTSFDDHQSFAMHMSLYFLVQVHAFIAFFSTGFPMEKVEDYIRLRKPFLVNDLEPQKVLWDRRKVNNSTLRTRIHMRASRTRLQTLLNDMFSGLCSSSITRHPSPRTRRHVSWCKMHSSAMIKWIIFATQIPTSTQSRVRSLLMRFPTPRHLKRRMMPLSSAVSRYRNHLSKSPLTAKITTSTCNSRPLAPPIPLVAANNCNILLRYYPRSAGGGSKVSSRFAYWKIVTLFQSTCSAKLATIAAVFIPKSHVSGVKARLFMSNSWTRREQTSKCA